MLTVADALKIGHDMHLPGSRGAYLGSLNYVPGRL